MSVLKFAPARRAGVAVPFEAYDLSFGFTTAALEIDLPLKADDGSHAALF